MTYYGSYLVELLVGARGIHIAERVVGSTRVGLLKALECRDHIPRLAVDLPAAQQQDGAVLVLELGGEGPLQQVQRNLDVCIRG